MLQPRIGKGGSHDEHLGEAPIEVIQEYVAKLPSRHPLIDDYKGKCTFSLSRRQSVTRGTLIHGVASPVVYCRESR
jgi:hypothetical protein